MAISSGTILKVVASLLMPDSVIAQNVFYAVITDLVTSDDEDDVVSDMVDWVEEMYTQTAGSTVSGVQASDVKVYEYDSVDDDWDEVGSDVWTDTFSHASDMMPHGVAFICHAKTTDPDTQATKYIGGFAETAALDSDVVAGTITQLADFCDSWTDVRVGTATGGDIGPGVWSEAGTVFKLFNGNYVVNGVTGYQRRRKPGVGI